MTELIFAFANMSSADHKQHTKQDSSEIRDAAWTNHDILQVTEPVRARVSVITANRILLCWSEDRSSIVSLGLVVKGSKVAAKVERVTRRIEHVQSISRSQRSTGTLGFYFSVPRFLHVNIKGGTPNIIHTTSKATIQIPWKKLVMVSLRLGWGLVPPPRLRR